MDELSSRSANGLTVKGVTFTVTGTATFNAPDGGIERYVQDPAILGLVGSTLTMDFPGTVSNLSVGVALSSIGSLTPGFTVQLFQGGTSLGSFPVNTTPYFTFSEGQFTSSLSFTRAVLTFAPGFNWAVDNVSFNASQEQKITFGPVTDHLASDAPFTVDATSSAGLPVTLSVVSGPATVSGKTVTLTGLGVVTLRASQEGSGNIRAASETISFNVTVGNPSVSLITNSATTVAGSVAAGSLASITGFDLASGQASDATGTALSLKGASLTVKDSAGTSAAAPLFFASFRQINFVVPSGLANGSAVVTTTNSAGKLATSTVTIDSVAPGLFTANSSGAGPASGVLLSYGTDGSFRQDAISSCSPFGCVPQPIQVVPGTTQYLTLFGTGIRNRTDLSAVKVTLGTISAPVDYAGPQGGTPGLDQVNVKLPASLVGAGLVDLKLTVDGVAANTVKVLFR